MLKNCLLQMEKREFLFFVSKLDEGGKEKAMNIKTPELIYDYMKYDSPLSMPDLSMQHSHNYYEMLYFEKGDATCIIEDRRYELHKDDLIFIRPTLYHSIEINSNEEYSRIQVSFSPYAIDKEIIKKIPEKFEIIHCQTSGIITDNFKKLRYFDSKLIEEKDFLDVLYVLLIEIIYSLSLHSEDVISIPSEISPLLTKALAYINSNLFTIKDVSEISSELFIAEKYLYKLFQTQLKITPKKYINTKRLLHAQKLLQRGKKPTEVYRECCFETYVGFYKQYVKIFGYPPSQEHT